MRSADGEIIEAGCPCEVLAKIGAIEIPLVQWPGLVRKSQTQMHMIALLVHIHIYLCEKI